MDLLVLTSMGKQMCVLCVYMRHTVLNDCVFLLLKQEIHSVSLSTNCQATHTQTTTQMAKQAPNTHLKSYSAITFVHKHTHADTVHTHIDYCG